jgi:hypothetical protein
VDVLFYCLALVYESGMVHISSRSLVIGLAFSRLNIEHASEAGMSWHSLAL